MMIFVAVLIARTVDGGGGVPIRAPTKKRSAERAREKSKDSCACARASVVKVAGGFVRSAIFCIFFSLPRSLVA